MPAFSIALRTVPNPLIFPIQRKHSPSKTGILFVKDKTQKRRKEGTLMDIYEMITQKVLDRIEEAQKNKTPFFWCKPWTGGAKLPISYTNQKAYNGVNFATLDAGEYITFKALQEYKGTLTEEEAEKIKIKKGCHKQPVFFMSSIDKKDDDGNVIMKKNSDGTESPEQIWYTKYYLAFNIEDIENLPSHFPAEHLEHTPTENSKKLDEYINAYARSENLTVDIVKDGGKCFYRPSNHMIRVPEASGFKSQYSVYSSILHEIMHSTSKGLSRPLGSSFGSAHYSREELVAQLASSMALNIFGIVPDNMDEFDNDAAYLKGWSDFLKDGKMEISKASAKAQQAVKYFIEVAERQLEKEKVQSALLGKDMTDDSIDR